MLKHLFLFSFALTSAQAIAQDDIADNVAHTRTLAASCAACHGTQGHAQAGNAVLAGMDSAYFIAQMTAFKTGTRTSTVMHRHAKGLKEDEINSLAAYFAAQAKTSSGTLIPQKLGRGHE